MLAADADALLAIDGAGGFGLAAAKENILELVHARVGEQQRRVVQRCHRGTGDEHVVFRFEKVDKTLTNFFGR